ncbi:MAG: ribosome recycling factor [Patescibacteria group bacterium]
MNFELQNLDNELNKVIDSLKNELSGIRTNRPTSKLVEDIMVDYFGQQTPIKQLGSISISLPRGIQITVWDISAAKSVAKAIESSSLGVNANLQGNTININLPALTEERRNEFIKVVKSLTENYRVRVRGLRDDYNKKIKQAADKKEVGEDEKFKLQKKVQEKIDKMNEGIDNLLENKIKEIKE